MSVSHRRIDHLVLAVRDLEAAADFYRGLGFQVGQRNRHPWGTENRLVQFQTSFLELITVGDDPAAIPPHEPGRFSFGAFVRDYLEKREGFAMFVLDGTNAKSDATMFAEKGIGGFEPFFFERKGRRPDGTETRVAFTLAFARDLALPDASFFVCQQHCPEDFWNPAFQVHPNGATGIGGVTLKVRDPSRHAGFLAGFTGVGGETQGERGLAFALRQAGRLLVEPGDGAEGFCAFTITVPGLAVAAEHLRRAGVPFSKAADRITVDAADAFGVTIGLSEHAGA